MVRDKHEKIFKKLKNLELKIKISKDTKFITWSCKNLSFGIEKIKILARIKI